MKRSIARSRMLVTGASSGIGRALAELAARSGARVMLVGLLGLSRTAGFEFHVAEWLGSTASDERPVAPELDKLRGTPLLCMYGSDEDDSPCPKLDPRLVTAVELGGGHHFGGDYRALARRILAALRPS